MTIADKLALLEQTKEAQRVKLGLPDNMPFSDYKYFMKPEFNVDYVFKNGEQGVWFDPSDLSTMFQDVNGTEPVTKDGEPVALIKDKSGNGNHAYQAIASARPIYRTDGELHWLEFDGVDDKLQIAYSLANSWNTVSFSYISDSVPDNFLIVDSGAQNPWGLAGTKGSDLTTLKNTKGISGVVKPLSINGKMVEVSNRGEMHKQVSEGSVLSFYSEYGRSWGDTHFYGQYSGGGYSCIKKLTGYIVTTSNVVDNPYLAKYLARKSGITL